MYLPELALTLSLCLGCLGLVPLVYQAHKCLVDEQSVVRTRYIKT